MKKIALLFIGPALIISALYTFIINNSKTNKIDASLVTTSRMQTIKQALIEFNKDCGSYPTITQNLNALKLSPLDKPKCEHYKEGGYLAHGSFSTDAWGRTLVYQHLGNKIRLLSFGSDGKRNGKEIAKDIIMEWSVNEGEKK